MNKHYYCVITAGGLGKKLWPVSKESLPKQFIPLSHSEQSMLRITYERFASLIPNENIIIVSHMDYEQTVKEHIPELKPDNLFLEPYSRNTAPCLFLAALKLLKRDPEAVIIASPSDQIITEERLFCESVEMALDYAAHNDSLITLGIIPDRADTNYGYIQADYDRNRDGNKPVKAKTFTEKPDIETAELFFQSGEFFWNSGIFAWKASTFKSEMEQYEPMITILFNGWENSLDTIEENLFLEKAYADCINISIEEAVIEKTEKSYILPVQFGWKDLGTWASVHESSANKDENGNSIKSYKSILHNCRNTLIYSTENKKLVAMKGLDDYIVINTDDVLLICPRDDKQIKALIADIAMPDLEQFR